MQKHVYNWLMVFRGLTILGLAMSLGVSTAHAAKQMPNIQNSIVKIIATHNHSDYRSPWQRRGIHTVTGSGAIIKGRRILTNAHVVADATLLEVKREGSGITYIAEVEYVCHSCDLALLTVDDPSFFLNGDPLDFDGVPQLQSRVSVYGFPTGGETISITQGIVSRIEVDYYVHSSDRFLLVQVDAAINPGNSGGPAISNGKIVGIAMQALEKANNIGYIVPVPIIKHFLDDVKDGQFDGFPELDIYVQLLENTSLRKSFNLPQGAGGLLITGVNEDSPLADILQPGDVLLAMDGYRIGRDGKISWEHGLRIEASHLEYRKQVGDTMTAKVFRDGKTLEVTLPLRAGRDRINQQEFDEPPTYYIFGGLVFQPLSNGYLKVANDNKLRLISYLPEYTLQGYKKLSPERIPAKRDQVIILSRVLPDAVNHGYKNMEGSAIYSVNGTPVEDMQQLIELIEKSQQADLKFITDFGNVILLQHSVAKVRNNLILQKYQINADRSLDLE